MVKVGSSCLVNGRTINTVVRKICVITGSAICEIYEKGLPSPEIAMHEIRKFATSIKGAIRKDTEHLFENGTGIGLRTSDRQSLFRQGARR